MTELRLDHVLIAVRDLSVTKDTFEKLGFKVTPEGRHPGRGTSNRLIVFGPEYLELISVHDPTGDLFRPNLVPFLEAREGLFIFCMGTSDVWGRVRDIRSKSIQVADPVQGSRQAADGSTAYSWTQAEMAPSETPGSQTFFIQHDHTVEERYTEPPNPTNHPNSVNGIFSLTLAVLNAETAARRWMDIFGLEQVPQAQTVDESTKKIRLRFENSYLDFVEPLIDGALTDFLTTYGEGAYEITFRCKDLDATQSLIETNDVLGLKRHVEFLAVPAESARGVRMTFVQE
jgi:catechol 2,3-dioxygenase-like lactoylglutathione lyase family enzyme